MSIHITHALRYGDLWFWSVTDDGASVGNGNCETMEGALTAIREAVLKYEAKANGN